MRKRKPRLVSNRDSLISLPRLGSPFLPDGATNRPESTEVERLIHLPLCPVMMLSAPGQNRISKDREIMLAITGKSVCRNI